MFILTRDNYDVCGGRIQKQAERRGERWCGSWARANINKNLENSSNDRPSHQKLTTSSKSAPSTRIAFNESMAAVDCKFNPLPCWNSNQEYPHGHVSRKLDTYLFTTGTFRVEIFIITFSSNKESFDCPKWYGCIEDFSDGEVRATIWFQIFFCTFSLILSPRLNILLV